MQFFQFLLLTPSKSDIYRLNLDFTLFSYKAIIFDHDF